MYTLVAQYVSTIFEPMVVLYALAFVGGKHAGIEGSSFIAYCVYLTLFMGFVTLVRLYFTSKDHTNWDISDRKKRIVPLLVLVVASSIQYGIVSRADNASLAALFLFLLVWVIGYFFITLKVKASGHLGILTLAILYCIAWYGDRALPLLLCIPLLSWSRLYLKRHTLQEIVVAILYSTLVFFASPYIIGRPW